MNATLILHACPTCGAKQDEPCQTPKGRKKETVHETRRFSIEARPIVGVPTR
jgi:hypothetical protein